MQQQRQLAAILFTDIVGSTAIMQKDEQIAMSLHKRYNNVLKQVTLLHGGDILNDFGDGSLCSFSSATEALRCAIEMQQQFQQEPKVPLRIGVHVGEIFFENGKVFGDGVNVASRVQSLGIANSILFSSEICSKIKNQSEFKSISLGRFHFKNLDEPMEVFALANEGLAVPKKEELSGKLKEIKKRSAKTWIISVIIIALIGLSLLLYKNFTNKGFSGEKTIAVLPFENIGNDSSEEYISDGITQDIINNLSKISSLQKVIAWFSVKGFKNTKKSVKEIADELGVAAILTGTIERESGKIHIITELVEVNTNKRLWGENYNYTNQDILSIQSNLAGEIVKALQASITPQEKQNLTKHYTENIDAYKFYIKGRSFWNASGPENIDSAEANYKRAIELEPNYALAYAGLADCHAVPYRGQSPLIEVPIAKAYLQKALSLDSNLSEALTTLGFIQQNFDYNWNDAKLNLEKAISLDPNNYAAHMFYGLLLINSGLDKNKALEEFKKAVDLDPLSYFTNWNYSRNLYFVGKYQLSIQQFDKMKSFISKPLTYVTDYSLGLIYLKLNDFGKAKEFFDRLPSLNGPIDNPQIMQCYGYAIIGDTIKAKIIFNETLKKYSNLSHYRNSQVYVALGNIDEALNELELSYDSRDVHMFWIKVDPAFDPIRENLRFKALLKKMNL